MTRKEPSVAADPPRAGEVWMNLGGDLLYLVLEVAAWGKGTGATVLILTPEWSKHTLVWWELDFMADDRRVV